MASVDSSVGLPVHTLPTGAPGTVGEARTADFFRKLIGENTATITLKLDNVTGDLAALTKTVEASKSELAAVSTELGKHATDIKDHRSQIEDLAGRLAKLERTGGRSSTSGNPDYLRARRSVRMWPIENESAETLWKGVGEFLHSALGIPESDVGPDDIETITPIPDPRHATGNLNKEALVTFFCPRKRDFVVSSSPSLANLMDGGVPTAGLRLEIPEALMPQFRLLSRFGTRLRARHGAGTKRHVKFDDLDCTLYMNIKLPGDETWSKVSVDTARADMDRAARAESDNLLRRIGTKPVLAGPRERLATQAPGAVRGSAMDRTARSSQDANVAAQGGPKPRASWAPREKRPV